MRFNDGTELEFDNAGNWKEIDCKYKVLPASILKLIPAPVQTFVKTNHPNSPITKIDSKQWGYEIELNNGLEIEFDKTGKFLRIDD